VLDLTSGIASVAEAPLQIYSGYRGSLAQLIEDPTLVSDPDSHADASVFGIQTHVVSKVLGSLGIFHSRQGR
jgi:hypothetical protein